MFPWMIGGNGKHHILAAGGLAGGMAGSMVIEMESRGIICSPLQLIYKGALARLDFHFGVRGLIGSSSTVAGQVDMKVANKLKRPGLCCACLCHCNI